MSADGRRSAEDLVARQGGRALLLAIYGVARALRLYPVENATVQRALDDLHAQGAALAQLEGRVEIRLSGEFIFVNQARLKLGLDNFAAFSGFVAMLRDAGVGAITIAEETSRREWQAFLAAIGSLPANLLPEERFDALLKRMSQAQITHIETAPYTDSESLGGGSGGDDGLERAKRTYAQGVAVARDAVQGVRMGRAPNMRRLKRSVQMLVDQVLENELSITGLTTLRDHDEYTFTHSVNVCIFAVALGRRLGLQRMQLYDLGLAALLHDIGKARIDLEVLHKESALDDTEWQRMQAHPWLGTLTLFRMREGEELPYRAILAAHEHHMRIDLTGYPRPVRPRRLGFFSRLIAVADGYDAATTRRTYQSDPWQPAAVLKEMWMNTGRGYDPVLVKALINLLGIYPVGTAVILDTFEVAIVAGPGSNHEELHRPLVRIAIGADGAPLPAPGELADLSLQNSDGEYLRTIVKVTSPDRYGITIGDYFI